MLVHLVAALLLQATTPDQPQAPAPPPPAPARDSTTGYHRDKKPPKRIAVTPQHLATAFRDPAARSILALAREARTSQDSALRSYDATTYQRISAGLALTKLGRDRLAFRSEEATRVRWRRGIGAYVDVTGSRAVVPIAGKSGDAEIDAGISPVPYFPGSETLWIGASLSQKDVDEQEAIVHPLATGSEAYYTFESGDSATFRLPDGKTIRLRELKIRPRVPKWNLAVGSLWFDMSGGQLVRAAYRMSVPMDIKAVAEEDDSTSFKDVPAVMKPMLFPMKAEISAIGVEYGLYQGRFWLPRLQVAQGGGQMGFVRVPFKLEQKFSYEHVNAGEPLAPIPVATDSARDEVDVKVSVGGPPKTKIERDAEREARREARRQARMRCDSTGNRTRVRHRNSENNLVLISISCDSTKLAHSPDLPPSIYDKGEEVMPSAEVDALVSQALSMGAQAGFSPTKMALDYAPLRYNRVEGLSGGGVLDQQLGAGYSVHALARIGVADLEPNVEITGARSDLRRTLGLTVYNRLVSASDWGNPLSTGSSIGALLFGRDEGFYYRATGIELSGAPNQGGSLNHSWSLFVEQERNAEQNTTFSFARAMRGSQFEPNITTQRALWVGGRTRVTQSIGEDPQGFRVFNDLRLEAARGDTGTYGRAALDVTASHGIFNGAAALTVAGGTSFGEVPLQRDWFLGGSQTVRGPSPRPAEGNAFWLARAEVAQGLGAVRPVVFGDIGWAGDRQNWSAVGVPISGAGAGFSILDGLLRFDVARGIQPTHQWRMDMYVEGRF
ncbi:MAG TPA: hypothetical protein VF461_01970 [Gemmatimonadaceae bacterium]